MTPMTSLPARILAAARGHALVLGLAVVAGGASIALIPGSRENAVMDLEAGRIAQSIEVLQRAVREGDRSAWTLATLARAREASGDPSGALGDLERLAAAHPNEVPILSALAVSYRREGRIEPLVGILQRLQTLIPNAERQRAIVAAEAELGRHEPQRSALEVLIGRFGATPDEHLALARLEAANGRPGEAAAAIAVFEIQYPHAVTAAIVAWDMTLRVAAGRADQALERGRMWLASGDRTDAPRLAEVFTQRRMPGLAVSLLEPFAGKGAKPDLVAALALAESESGDRPAALRHFEAYQAMLGDSPPRDLRIAHLRLALGLGEAARAVAVTEGLGLDSLPADLVPAVAAAALRANRVDLARVLREEAGEAIALADPLVAAQIDLALGDWAGARRRVGEAAQEAEGDPARVVALAGLRLRMGDRAGALAVLRPLAAFDVAETASTGAQEEATGQGDAQALPPGLLRDVARLYVDAGAPREGEALLRMMRRSQPGPDADLAWSLAAIAAGRTEAVRAWLDKRGETPIGAEHARELALAATRAGASGLAADAALRLVRERGTDEDRMVLAEARLSAGRPWIAAPALPAAVASGGRITSRSVDRPTLR